ncbi:MAG: rhamnulokinase family protein [candidate division FCPU426 bacterium]
MDFRHQDGDFGCLAVDLGAESGRVAWVGLDSNNSLSLKTLHRFSHSPLSQADGLRWDIPTIWNGILEGMRQAGSLGLPVASIGVDAWAVDYALLEAQGGLVTQPFCYRDPRGERGRQALASFMDPSERYARRGLQDQPFNTVNQLKAHALEAGKDLQKASQLLLLPDFWHFKLSGVARTEWTNASTTGLLDLGNRNWDPGICAEVGLRPELLPAIEAPGTCLGALLPEWSAATGLKNVQVVLPPTHDTASAVVAVPVATAGEDWAYLSSGTWSLMGLELASPLLSDAARQAGFSNEGGVDQSTRFLKNIMGLWLIQRLKAELAPDLDYAGLMEEAAQAEPLRCVFNAADPRLFNPASMAATVAELCVEADSPRPDTLARAARACMESLALEYRRTKEQLETLCKRTLKRLYIVGGGSQNALLCQMTANACGLEVHAGPAEGACLGNALIQARGLGRLQSLQQARSIVAKSFPPLMYSPRSSQDWDRLHEQQLTLQKRSAHA